MLSLRTLSLLAGIGLVAYGLNVAKNHYIGVGVAQEQARQDRNTVIALQDQITAHEALIASANSASLALQAATQSRLIADDKSTQELKNALQKTAAERVGCRFDADSLRLLDDARTRAIDAATGGLRHSAAAAGGAPGQ